MSLINLELETRLLNFANSYLPKLPVAWEGKAFEKPVDTPFLEAYIVPASTVNVTTDGLRIRQRGIFMVNVWAPDGKGRKIGDDIAEALIATFPIVPKVGRVSIEQTPNADRAIVEQSGWRIVPVSVTYRFEN